ncbi:MAG: hypothetical protein H7239_13160 [Flavobacterium sp.]|nr:hypothetical protein [Flavobacterium sp.]
MNLEDVKRAIEGVLNAKTIEDRDQKLDYLINDVPLDRCRIEEIEQDIEELRKEAHNLDSKISVSIIKDIIEKYKL